MIQSLLKKIQRKVTHTVSVAYSDIEFTIGVKEPNLSKLAEARTIPFELVRILSVVRHQHERVPEQQQKQLMHVFVAFFAERPIFEGSYEVGHPWNIQNETILDYLYDITRNYKQYLPQLKEPDLNINNVDYKYVRVLNMYIMRRKMGLVNEMQKHVNRQNATKEDQEILKYVESLPHDKKYIPPRKIPCTIT